MSNGRKNITAFLLLTAAFMHLNAQVNVKVNVDRNSILIGEPIRLSVEAYVPLGTDVSWFPADTIPHFDIIRRSGIDTSQSMDGKKITQLLTITSFDSGRWSIPAFVVSVAGQPYYSDSLDIDVAFADFDPKADYRDIKDIVEVANPLVAYVPWAIGLIAICSLCGIYLLLRNKQPVMKNVPVEESNMTAYEEAMQAIGALKKRGIVEDGEKGYYSSLNDILRKYVASNFHIPTFEKTNEELIIRLSTMGIPRDAFIKLSQSLRMSDFVKFAKYRPSEEDNLNNLETVRSSIDILNTPTLSAV